MHICCLFGIKEQLLMPHEYVISVFLALKYYNPASYLNFLQVTVPLREEAEEQ